MHAALVVSTILSQYFIYYSNLVFPWSFDAVSITALGIALVVCPYIIGRFGFAYFLSSLTQELTMLSIAFYLFGNTNFVLILLLIVPIYAVAHLLNTKYWKIKIPIISLWGILSIILFYYTQDVFLNTALHAVFGSVLIRTGMIYVQSDFSIKRSEVKLVV